MSDIAFAGLEVRAFGARHGITPASLVTSPEAIGTFASYCLNLELETWPKPGLVSHVDTGSHKDMDAELLRRSAAALAPYFAALAQAGSEDATMDRLRAIGMDAEATMLSKTRGVNTHRGAIFGLGLLCAAAGRRGSGLAAPSDRLGTIVRRTWGRDIENGPVVLHSHGTKAGRRYGASGARGEAAGGFPSVYTMGLPALEHGALLAPYDAEAVRVQAIFTLIAGLKDTNLLHRGGSEGLSFARISAGTFLRHGGIGRPGWRLDAAFIHAEFVKRGLSPGGSADLLAMSLFVQALESGALESGALESGAFDPAAPRA